MGTYGLDDETEEVTSQAPRKRTPNKNSSVQSRDVVDNAQSKMAHPVSQRKYISKSRLDDQILNDSNLSKSLPTTLPSYSNYSSTNGHGKISPRNKIYVFEGQTKMSDEDEETSDDEDYQMLPQNVSHNRKQSHPYIEEKRFDNRLLLLFITILAIVISFLYKMILFHDTSNYDDIQFHKDLRRLGNDFQISYDTILKIQSGITTTSERDGTGSFIFVYNSKNSNYNHTHLSNFIDSVAATSAKYLRNDISQIRHVVISNTDLDMNTHVELMQKYRDIIAKQGVMLVKQIEEIPSNLAMAFHYYCDEYNPLVKKSAIFFTLDLKKCSQNLDVPKVNHATIEKCLTKIWNKVPDSNLAPLLTRVVSVVIDLTT